MQLIFYKDFKLIFATVDVPWTYR